ncbi:hypothetical protein PI124_g20888 [Phytophthora idaei]|nr:hypothetical protein PI125_g22374 [Phytophthora idaei]KAG3130307.1 hypothetical protein PI126_g20574 [Phytophthora idaei]KAG3234053.1 hypothetical protein PI124_g20888 [Phytophthora idaei]
MRRCNAHHRITAAVEKLKELDSVWVKLQAQKCSMADVPLLFDACAAKYPVMADYLNPSADIIHSPDFEMEIVKTQNDLSLPSSEEDAVEDFIVEPNDPTPAPCARVDFASTVLRQAKKQRCASHFYLVSQRSTMSYCTSSPLRGTRANAFSLSANWC